LRGTLGNRRSRRKSRGCSPGGALLGPPWTIYINLNQQFSLQRM
jgi:hypothetical protein